MDQHPPIDSTVEEGDVDVLTKTYRHDAHKFLGTPHEDAPELFEGGSMTSRWSWTLSR